MSIECIEQRMLAPTGSENYTHPHKSESAVDCRFCGGAATLSCTAPECNSGAYCEICDTTYHSAPARADHTRAALSAVDIVKARAVGVRKPLAQSAVKTPRRQRTRLHRRETIDLSGRT